MRNIISKPVVRTLVIDFDGTLAYSVRQSSEKAIYPTEPSAMLTTDRDGVPGSIALFIRPYAYQFLQKMSSKYRLVLWSYGDSGYIAQCLSLTRFKPYFRGIISRQNMVAPLKDLYALDPDLTNIVVIDDSNNPFGMLNPYNCIDIPSWSAGNVDDTILNVMPSLVDFHFNEVLTKHNIDDLLSLRMYIIAALTPPEDVSSSHPADAPEKSSSEN